MSIILSSFNNQVRFQRFGRKYRKCGFFLKDIIPSLNKTLALKMKEYQFEVSWSLAFLMHGTFEL
jgi:hypothetical protein